MVMGNSLKDARYLAPRYDRLRQQAGAQAVGVARRRAKVREGNVHADMAIKLEEAEAKLQDLRSNVATLEKDAADVMATVEAQKQRLTFAMVITDRKPKGTLKLPYNFGEKFTHGGETHKNGHDQHVSTFAAEQTGEPMTAYPAPPGAHPGMGHPPQYAPPYQAAYGGYPAQPSGYGYMPPPQPGYGYQPPPQGGYPLGPPAGYAGYPAGPEQKPKKNKMGMGGGLGLGLGAGLLGGLLVGEAIDDIGDAASYADGYDDAMGDMGGGFDF